MKKVLLTGGIGQAVIRHSTPSTKQQLYLTYRKESDKIAGYNYFFFDFEQLEKSRQSLEQMDILFLLRPPHISYVQA